MAHVKLKNMSVVYSKDPFGITEEGGSFVLYKDGNRVKEFPTKEKAMSAVTSQNSAFQNGRDKARIDIGARITNSGEEAKVKSIAQSSGKTVHPDWIKKLAQALKDGVFDENDVKDAIKRNNYSGPNY